MATFITCSVLWKRCWQSNQTWSSSGTKHEKQLLNAHLLPDPDAVKIRVYATTSTHKSLSCFRQGSYIMVNDDCWESTEASFKEAFFAHTSTSPNLQLIASLDVARRQAELEGYELVGRSIELSLILRREVNKHPLISKYFRIATNAQMVPPSTGTADSKTSMRMV